MDPSPAGLALVAAASMAAGLVNALAGGGTLITFPALTLAGLPAVEANITATVGQNAGYLGGSVAQRADLAGQRDRLVRLIPAAAAGGVTGAYLLSVTSEELFRAVVPWLIFAACGLLGAQDRIRGALERRRARRVSDGGTPPARPVGPGLLLATYVPAIYGGYFGAGLGIVVLAVLGVVLDDDLRRLNALKQTLSLVINLSAGALLVFSGRVAWGAAAVVAAGSLAGGVLGGRLAGRIDPRLLRRVVIAIGLVVGLVYLLRPLFT
jgi:uncharacterized membrane protein YfcA